MKEAVLTYSPTFQTQPLAITGDLEVVQDIHADLQAQEAALLANQPKEVPKPVQAPEAPKHVELAYEDFSALPRLVVARMKLRSRFYDAMHSTRMLDLLNERIDNDRDVAFARNLGLVGITHCRKHEAAVSKLRELI